MNAPARDPARAVLAVASHLTVEKQRLPRLSDLERRVRAHGNALRLLLDDGRYLVRVERGDDKAAPVRAAVTIRGLLETETDLAQRELQGLARTHDRLCRAVRDGVFARAAVKASQLRSRYATDMDPHDFRRWCTLLCSPRLQGRYADPTGFYGRTDAFGTPTKTGFFDWIYIAPSFLEWRRLPTRGERRPFLFPEHGLRVDVGKDGTVDVLWGAERIAVLPSSLGARVFAALVSRPRREIHALDLQSQAANHTVIPDDPRIESFEIDADLFNVGIRDLEFEVERCDTDELERLAALLRRIFVLEELATSGGPLPKWAREPAKRRQDMVDQLRTTLVDGPPKADDPLVKNATRAVRRALDGVLEHEALAQFAGDFEGNERLVYRPRS